jgi:YHS domain-containing protein
MKLRYRGQTYEYHSSQQAKQPFQSFTPSGKPYNLKYRGVTYHVDPNTQSAKVPLSPKAYKLMYRGLTYFINRTAQREVAIVSQPASLANLESAVLER